MKHSQRSTITPLKINMEPENTPLEEENHLPNEIIFRFYINLQGCINCMPHLLSSGPMKSDSSSACQPLLWQMSLSWWILLSWFAVSPLIWSDRWSWLGNCMFLPFWKRQISRCLLRKDFPPDDYGDGRIWIWNCATGTLNFQTSKATRFRKFTGEILRLAPTDCHASV